MSAFLSRFLKQPLWEKFNTLAYCWARLKTQTLYRIAFGSLGRGSTVWRPLMLSNAHCVQVGKKVLIRNGARIEVVLQEGKPNPKVIIHDGVTIEQNLHLGCAQEVIIEENATLSSNVGIWDVWHTYDDPEMSILKQPLKTAPVRIGANCLIGTGCVIMPGVSIGRNSVIGSNSVVIKSIPDCCVAAGIPARVIKRYDAETKKWLSVKHDQ